ncbi:MAG TPA: alanine dehydrogenase, partial [Vicinamibacteria bacterium]|nr:alanine dehydrogenase [Vicinamibacteria bacterium]
TSTYALTNVTLPYALNIANKGVVNAVRGDRSLGAGVNTYKGHLTSEAVAVSQGREHTPIERLL